MNPKFLITGATGDLGRRVIKHLKGEVAPDQLAVLVRDPANAQAQQYQQDGIATMLI